MILYLDYLYEKKTLHYFLTFWIILTFGNCAMDLTLAIHFGFDYTDLIVSYFKISFAYSYQRRINIIKYFSL